MNTLCNLHHKCISLQKGQTCYQRVQFRWTSQNPEKRAGLMCLWREGEGSALQCWENATEGKYRYALEAAQTTRFYLVAGELQQPIVARTAVTINWVYSSRSASRSRWRLF